MSETVIYECDGVENRPVIRLEYEARDAHAMELEMVRLVSVAFPFCVLSRRTSWRPELARVRS